MDQNDGEQPNDELTSDVSSARMNPQNSSAVKELFNLLLDAQEASESDENAEQAKRVAELALAQSDAQIRRTAQKLLQAHQRADTGLFYEPKIAPNTISTTGSPALHLRPPIIDGYEVGDEIGRGGFGVVYRGEQITPVRRTVAIKILRTDLATPAMVSRFETEASVLARMNHPGIARVIDAGLDRENRPFVTMELIEGEPIVSYCTNNDLAIRQRVQIIEQVCDAVHHAHQRAVIHRDLKPANILVERQGERVHPRVIDFGIAKLLEAQETDKNTLDGHRLGTPRYMSPEQSEGTGEVDIRIDVYALGVLLCEVLTGQVPYANKETSSPATHTRRSTRSSTRPSALIIQSDPTKRALSSALQGDLDRIVLKAAALDAEQRYQSAAAMSEDLRRYLSGMPVLAADPGIVYRGTKFLKRHKLASSLIAVALLGLVVGGVGLSVGLGRATESRDVAQLALKESERQRQRAEFVNRFLLEDMLLSVDPNVNQGREISVREVFENASTKLSDREDIDIETQYTTLRLIGLVYSKIGSHDEAMSSFRRAAELAEQLHGQPCAEAIEIRLDLYDVIVSHGRSGMTKLGEQLNQDAQAVLSPTDNLYRRVRLRTTNSIEELEEITASIKSDPNPDHEEYLRGMASLANLYAFSFDLDNELETRRQSYELSNTIYGPDHSSTFGRLGHYAAIRSQQYPDLETLDLLYRAYEPSRRVLGLEHPSTLSIMRTYANLLGKLIDPNAAIVLLEECEHTYQTHSGLSSIAHTANSSVLGEQYLLAGRAQDALKILIKVRDDRAKQWSANHINNVMAHFNLAQCYLMMSNAQNARAEALAAQKIVRPKSLLAVRVEMLISQSLVMLGLNSEANLQAQHTLSVFELIQPSSSSYFKIGEELAELLDEIDEPEHAQGLRTKLQNAQKAISSKDSKKL